MAKVKLILALIGISLLFILLYQQNNELHLTRITVSHRKLPVKFNGFKITHLSDLHNKLMKK